MKTKFILLLFLLLSFQIGKSQYTIDFSADVTQGCAPLFVTFTSTTNVPSPNVWIWTFGDGGSAVHYDSSDVTHGYINPFSYSVSYSVSLRIINGSGIDTTITKPNFITVFPKPIVDFTHTMSGDTVQFIDQTPSLVAQWNWDLGNGTTSNYANPITTYPFPPDSCYDVTSIVTSFDGCVGSLTKTVCITNVEELAAKNITIYPSPIINNQKLIVKGNINGLEKIIGYNVLGNLISLPIISKNENELIFETNQLDKGVYFLQLHFDDKTVITKKIVVQ